MSNSLSLLFKKERSWANRSCCSLLKSDMIELLSDMIKSLSKNERFAWKICIFCMFLTVFPLFMPKSEALLLLFAHLLFFKELPWAIRSCHSLQKSERAIRSKKMKLITISLFRSHKKLATCSKNQRANSQPCRYHDSDTTSRIPHVAYHESDTLKQIHKGGYYEKDPCVYWL